MMSIVLRSVPKLCVIENKHTFVDIPKVSRINIYNLQHN